MPVPAHPKIYHIVHVDNLASTIGDGCLWSDSIVSRRTETTVIGMNTIKRRRLHLPVPCHSGTHVGDSVPFYFCPHSIMLYVIYRANAPELQYRGGQEPIIHLEADLHTVIQWADTKQRTWAFSLSNAGAIYAQFRSRIEQLDKIDWTSVASNDFRNADVKEAKQAEFLVHHSFPWHLFERVGVYSEGIAQRVALAMQSSNHRPRLEIAKAWYYLDVTMIEFKTGDILKTDVEAVVNTVNCVGIMGRGIALQFKRQFPDNFVAYKSACDRGEVQPGRIFVFETRTLTNPKYVLNFPTKRHWRGKSRMEDIETGLQSLVDEVKVREIRSMAIPPLGSGLGGLKWSSVRRRIEAAFATAENVSIIVFEPSDIPVVTTSREVPTMTTGRATIVALMSRYLSGLMDPFISLLEVHKLMYFMQEAGEPLRLQYKKAPYGPYAENLRHVFHVIEGHLISGYSDGGDSPQKQIELVPGAMADAEAFLSGKQETLARIDRVGDLVEGFETPFGLELLATVHWAVNRQGAANVDDATRYFYRWNARKFRFTQRQIGIAYDRLGDQGWLENTTKPPR